MRTHLAVMLGVACLAPALSAAQEDGGKSAAAVEWAGVHEEELKEQVFPIAVRPGEIRAIRAVRCRLEGTPGTGPVLYELANYGAGQLVLKTRTLTAPNWAAAVLAAAPGNTPLDVGSIAPRIQVTEMQSDGVSCPALVDLVAQLKTLSVPVTARYFTVPPGPRVACEFKSIGLTTVAVSVVILDADEPWKPFLDWVKRLSNACPAK